MEAIDDVNAMMSDVEGALDLDEFVRTGLVHRADPLLASLM